MSSLDDNLIAIALACYFKVATSSLRLMPYRTMSNYTLSP